MGNMILILANSTDKHLGLFSDLEHCKCVILHYVLLKKVGWVLRFFRRIHLSSHLNFGNHWPPLRHLWYDTGKDLPLDNVKTIVVINACLDKISVNYLKRCKRMGIYIVLIILDSVDADSITVHKNRHLYFLPLWDKVISYDPVDAKKYGFTYKGFCYYSKYISLPLTMRPKNDIYFTGNTKGGRVALINSTFVYFTANGCKCIYDVQLKSKTDEQCQGINYVRRWVKYEEVLRRLSDCKCILEILQTNQYGPSLRYFEAIFYNKKLITTNPNIINYPYYNSKWMKIIRSPEELDIEWIKSTERVDYQYNGDFSPIHLIDFLNKNE